MGGGFCSPRVAAFDTLRQRTDHQSIADGFKPWARHKSPPGHNFEIHQPRSQSIGNSKNVVCKIFNEHIRNSVGPVYQIEYFKTGPDIIKTKKWAMAAPVASVSIEQQSTEPNVHSDVGLNDQGISILDTAGNIVRKIAAIDHVQVDLKIFICRQVILEEHPECNQPVGRSSHPALFHR